MLPDFPIRTPNKAGLLGHQPLRGGGNDVRGSRAASCGHRGVVHATASIMSESSGPQSVSSCSPSTQPPSPGRLGKQNKSHIPRVPGSGAGREREAPFGEVLYSFLLTWDRSPLKMGSESTTLCHLLFRELFPLKSIFQKRFQLPVRERNLAF